MNHYELKKFAVPDFAHIVLGRTIYKQKCNLYPYKSISLKQNNGHLKLNDLRELIVSEKYQTPVKFNHNRNNEQHYASCSEPTKSKQSVYQLGLSVKNQSSNQRLKNILLKKTVKPTKVLNIQFEVRSRRERSTMSLNLKTSKTKNTQDLKMFSQKSEIKQKYKKVYNKQHRRCRTQSVEPMTNQFYVQNQNKKK